MEAQCEQRDDPHRLERKGSKHEEKNCSGGEQKIVTLKPKTSE